MSLTPPREDRFSTTEREEVEVNEEEREARVTRTIRDRRIYNTVDLVGWYPLTRNLRVEGSLGYTRITLERVEERLARESDGGFILSESRTVRPVNPLNLFRTPAAFVGDYADWGYTGPLRGRRFRIEGEPTFGTAQYLTATADYRENFYFWPITLAARAYHRGRYFPAGRTDLLSPLSLGFPTLVRGYEPWSFADADDSAYESSRGTRLLAVNIELRAPLFGSGIGVFATQPFPLTLLLFFDGGTAWLDGAYPSWQLQTPAKRRVPLTSAGAALRLNLGNVIFLEVYWAYPFQRRRGESVTAFQFRTGF